MRLALRVFKTKWFARFAKRAGIRDSVLCNAIKRADRGLVDADLGGDVFKQRISRDGRGQKTYRTLIAFRFRKRAIFIYGFAKNERENIDDDELVSLKEIAKELLKMNDQEIKRSLADGHLQEVIYEKEV